MALSVVYFRIMHCLGRPHYVWDKYLILCSVIVLCRMMMKGREKVKPGAGFSRKTPRGPPGLMSPSNGRIAINSTICLLNIYTAEGFGI